MSTSSLTDTTREPSASGAAVSASTIRPWRPMPVVCQAKRHAGSSRLVRGTTAMPPSPNVVRRFWARLGSLEEAFLGDRGQVLAALERRYRIGPPPARSSPDRRQIGSNVGLCH